VQGEASLMRAEVGPIGPPVHPPRMVPDWPG
jgi:hypothetical protein